MCLAPEGWGRTRQGNDVRAAVVPGGQVALSRGGAGPPAAGAVCPSLTLAAMGTPPRRPADKAACSRQGPLAHRKSPPPGRPWAAGSPPRAAWMRDKAPVTDCKAAALLGIPVCCGRPPHAHICRHLPGPPSMPPAPVPMRSCNASLACYNHLALHARADSHSQFTGKRSVPGELPRASHPSSGMLQGSQLRPCSAAR